MGRSFHCSLPFFFAEVSRGSSASGFFRSRDLTELAAAPQPSGGSARLPELHMSACHWLAPVNPRGWERVKKSNRKFRTEVIWYGTPFLTLYINDANCLNSSVITLITMSMWTNLLQSSPSRSISYSHHHKFGKVKKSNAVSVVQSSLADAIFTHF